MECVAAVRLLVVQVAVGEAPPPARATAAHPAIEAPPSVKFTVPVGVLPATVAVKVTLLPTVDGLSELVSVVVDAVGTPPAAVHASISVMRAKPSTARVTLTRMALVVNAAKLTGRLTRLLPTTGAPRLTHAAP